MDTINFIIKCQTVLCIYLIPEGSESIWHPFAGTQLEVLGQTHIGEENVHENTEQEQDQYYQPSSPLYRTTVVQHGLVFHPPVHSEKELIKCTARKKCVQDIDAPAVSRLTESWMDGIRDGQTTATLIACRHFMGVGDEAEREEH